MIFGSGLIAVMVKNDEGLGLSYSIGIGKARIDGRGDVSDCTSHRPDDVVKQLTRIDEDNIGKSRVFIPYSQFLNKARLLTFLQATKLINGTGLSS